MPDTIADRYEVIETIGRGGMASVLLAEDKVLGRRVAVKRVHTPEVGSAERLAREARIGAQLNHPNIVKVFDTLTPDGEALIVMEYVEGETLRDALRDGPLETSRALEILRQTASALDHIHDNGVVHRDVKPGNVLIARDGTAKLADLGIARSAESTRITAEGAAVGSVPYMAPEQLGGEDVGPPADVYALAALAYEALSGRRARTTSNPVELMNQMAAQDPPDLRTVMPGTSAAAAGTIARALAFEPSDRPARAGDFVRELEQALAGAPEGESAPPAAATTETTPAAPPAAPPAPPQRAPARRAPERAPYLALGGALVAILVAVAAVALLGREDGSADRRSGAPAASPAATETATPEQAAAGDPAQAVRDWYGAMAAQDTDRQCELTGPALDCRRYVFETLREIEFSRAEVTDRQGDSAAVAIRTEARHVDRTDRCAGTVSTVRSDGVWKVNALQVSC